MDKEKDKDFIPAYLKLPKKSLREKIQAAKEICTLCPRIGDLVIDDSGIALRGLLVRHLSFKPISPFSSYALLSFKTLHNLIVFIRIYNLKSFLNGTEPPEPSQEFSCLINPFIFH